MAVNKSALVAAISKFRDDTATAVKFHDPDRTNSANTRRKHEGVMAARGELLKSLPAEPETPKVTPATVLADRAPRTADQVAVAQHEFALVERLLASGQPVEALILGATPARLDALLAHAEVLPSVLGSSDPASVVADVQRQAFDRLVELGDPKATIAQEAQRQHDEQAAWREVVKDTIEGRETGAGMTALFQSDREGFDALSAANTDPVRDSDTGERVRQLDRVFNVGAPQGA
ncbi:hypothetical protein [Microbacterium dextranolyticum]|uniref:Uncharacterized protein n=1 Tax=Microbacterium dextranolyticum TaxID=36806 RepID=A0A9W6HMA4_9MICO|nr:hypothetical protein [Microbacterium dextranolyticum]MBM7463231.1 hypothetical protein [Microbacterium dextranolyticum]GLJ95663.1 hypothetical protein GCM10017591_17260 [Microbacterium dextranolyticum]